MADKQSKPLTREGKPSQRIEKGLEIPVPTQEDFFGVLKKTAR